MSREQSEDSLALRIASLVHAHFDALPTKSKPHIQPDGSREWIPMTGIVAVKGENTSSESLHCITVTSGAKCLSASHITRCRGLVLHDCHAEILALRAFNYWLMAECHAITSAEHNPVDHSSPDKAHPQESSFLCRNIHDEGCKKQPSVDCPPFELQPDVRFYMYCTCAPCGDGSMELCMAAQEDATPWEVVRHDNSQVDTALGDNILLDGRAHFSLLGVVRRKPARTDAESTRSKSCSDKLALRQVSSLLSWQTSRLVSITDNAYLAGLILPEDEISRVACDRAFGQNGRMAALVGQSWSDHRCGANSTGYQYHPFEVISVPADKVSAMWQFAKPKPTDTKSTPDTEDGKVERVETPSRKSKPGNISAVWTLAPSVIHAGALLADTGSKSLPSLCRSKTGLYESIISGVKQGNKAASPGARGASALSRAKMWSLFKKVTETNPKKNDDSQITTTTPVITPERSLQQPSGSVTYENVKSSRVDGSDISPAREQAILGARQVLKGWARNTGDEDWGLDVLHDAQKRKRGVP